MRFKIMLTPGVHNETIAIMAMLKFRMVQTGRNLANSEQFEPFHFDPSKKSSQPIQNLN